MALTPAPAASGHIGPRHDVPTHDGANALGGIATHAPATARRYLPRESKRRPSHLARRPSWQERDG
jgi:hypothetical protein